MLYFKIDPSNNVILDALDGDFAGYNTKVDAAINGKPYLVEVIITDPIYDSATQVKEGPIDSYDGAVATRIYTVRGKTQEELNSENATIRIITPREFRFRLTYAEQIAINTACVNDPEVFMWRLAAAEAQEIDLNHEETLLGLQFLVAKGLLAPERISELLA